MEEYAVNRLIAIFQDYDNEMSLEFNRSIAQTIINAMIEKNQNYEQFKNDFWKLLWNIKIKGPERSKKTLDNLFNGKWNNVQDFINASHDELDEECANFRANIRLREFYKMENTKKINASLDQETCVSYLNMDTVFMLLSLLLYHYKDIYSEKNKDY